MLSFWPLGHKSTGSWQVFKELFLFLFSEQIKINMGPPLWNLGLTTDCDLSAPGIIGWTGDTRRPATHSPETNHRTIRNQWWDHYHGNHQREAQGKTGLLNHQKQQTIQRLSLWESMAETATLKPKAFKTHWTDLKHTSTSWKHTRDGAISNKLLNTFRRPKKKSRNTHRPY